MNTILKRIMIISLCTTVGGLIIAGGAYAAGAAGTTARFSMENGFYVAKSKLEPFTLNETITEPVTSLRLNLEYINTTIESGDTFKIEAQLPERSAYDVSGVFYEINDGELSINCSSDYNPSVVNIEVPNIFDSYDYSERSIRITIPHNTKLSRISVQSASQTVINANLEIDELSINNSRGDITLENLKVKNIKANKCGSAILKNMRYDNLYIDNNYGTMTIDGDSTHTARLIDLGANNANVSIKNTNADKLIIDHSYDALDIENCRFQNLDISTEQSTLILKKVDVTERLSAKLHYGMGQLSNCTAGEISLSSTSAKIELSNITADLAIIETDYASQTLSHCDISDLSLTSSNGTINADNVTAKTAKLKNEYAPIHLTNWESEELHIRGDNSEVRVSGTLKGLADISTQYADVLITLLDGRDKMSAKLTTKYGEIYIDGESEGESVTYKHDSPSTTLNIATDNGSIFID